MEREKIIKALECCKTVDELDCKSCGYKGKIGDDGAYIGCVNCLIADALSLINELTEENERLREDNHILATEFKDKIISDTVRKMQERLEDRASGTYSLRSI